MYTYIADVRYLYGFQWPLAEQIFLLLFRENLQNYRAIFNPWSA